MKYEFYRDVQRAAQMRDKNRKCIVLGEFNAQTDVVHNKTDFNSDSVIEDKNCNENGYRIKSYCRSANLRMAQLSIFYTRYYNSS